jgi:PleD family two-component response regulator
MDCPAASSRLGCAVARHWHESDAVGPASATASQGSSGETITVVDRVGIAKVLIVDDHPMVREGLTMRLSAQPDLQVCGEAACEDEAVAVVKQTRPDLVLVDIALKSGDGIELVKQIKPELFTKNN